ncbi:gem-associated protein 6-like [Arctopsyche grandis]|uniref:gem-associated protein 6-like n=1 Tax=Arctopsyche grandis TaxID=121162 RepID=UPI00406D89AB
MNSDGAQPLHTQPPSKLACFIGTYVSICTSNNSNYEGFVDAIDPYTGSIILSTLICGVPETKIVVGFSIRDITIKDPPPDRVHRVFISNEKSLDQTDIQSIKSKTHSWLLRNLLPVKEVDDKLHVHDGHVIISPPYKPENCTSSNSIVLGRIQHLLQNMPSDSMET